MGTGPGHGRLLKLLRGRGSKKEPRKAEDPTPTPEEKELPKNPGGKASGPGPAGSPVGADALPGRSWSSWPSLR